MKRFRTAVIGTGFMGRVHLEALRRIEFVDVAAIAGREVEAAKRLGAGFGIETAVDDYRKLLEDVTIDAVHICTPNATHYQIAKDALLAGKHVLCEKPLSVSVVEAQELVRLARERTLRNCVCHNLRYYPMVQQMRRMREDGELGDVHVKDFKRSATPPSNTNRPAVAELGQGTIDYAPIFEEAAKAGHVKHCFAEQEAFNVPWIQSLKIDADYLRKLGMS